MIYVRVQLQVSVLGTTRQGIWYIVIFIYRLTIICLWKYDGGIEWQKRLP